MNVSSSSSLDASLRAELERQQREQAATPAGPPSQSHEARLGAAIDRIPSAKVALDYSVFAQVQATAPVTPVDPQAAKDTAVQARMNACRDAASGPYTVNGQKVMAAPMFRMPTHHTETRYRELKDIGREVGLNEGQVHALSLGQGSNESLVKLTQALIDRGKLPRAPADLAGRIKTMQWNYGIGFDCAGYSKEAMRAARGAPIAFHDAGSEGFTDIDSRTKDFARVRLGDARPGDLITLKPGEGEFWGHNVVVYENKVVDDAERKALVASGGAAVKVFLSPAGPFRAIRVDSSWGAGENGDVNGGYRRATWLYNETTKEWASFAAGVTPPQLEVSKTGPSGDVFHGVYRPR